MFLYSQAIFPGLLVVSLVQNTDAKKDIPVLMSIIRMWFSALALAWLHKAASTLKFDKINGLYLMSFQSLLYPLLYTNIP